MRKFFARLFLAATLLLVVVLVFAGWWAYSPVGLREPTVEFTIAPGSSLRTAAREIAGAGIDLPAWRLVALGKVLQVDSAIKAGSYQLQAGVTPLELLRKLTRGDVTQAELTLIEGWTFRQVRQRLDAHPDLRHDTAGLSESEILRRLGAVETRAEGLIFPDTYLFAKQSSDIEVLARAYRAGRQRLSKEWQSRQDKLPYREPYQALIMASIVEKETGRDEDRAQIAGVFVNRLRQNMRLQTDPTVIYGLGEQFDGNLRQRDLLSDTPYNTYTRPGLPPTPIAMPGQASLRAALHPAATDALYFVARGDGSSQFSRTLEEHNRAVSRYQRGGK
ncbi:MAG TPA: endolytic transglycosylase MltG [Accumulibacter sp.]|nr:endolytic transglycosylase MltG [Accumulibacter sp.]HMW17423.1 endolytic transglycosylase MltG [Accumulibacter sp.]HMX22025.1 endolytic transglycosylase MltG [Accumulibacter sp.]HMY07154.1 endolytic transglycosylase MltG [Accumulibacter sp.]HNC17806.1 endolytic transglycosylase MltG [Accumulibacter sp.]